MSPEEALSYLQLEEDPKICQSKLIKICCRARKIEEKPDYNLTSLDDYGRLEKHLESIHDIILKTRKEYPNNLFLNIMGAEMAQKMTRHRQINGTDIMKFIRTNTDLSIFISHDAQDTQRYLSQISDVHLRFIVLNGSLFLRSLIPRQYLYAVIPHPSTSNIIKLDPVV